MAKIHSGATVDGRKPILSEMTHEYGVRGKTGEVGPEEKQVAEAGAKKSEAGPGVKLPTTQKESGDLNTPKAAAERISTGTTAEEQRKRLAAKLYPSSRGLREYGAGTT